jgi:hypothetical protein
MTNFWFIRVSESTEQVIILFSINEITHEEFLVHQVNEANVKGNKAIQSIKSVSKKLFFSVNDISVS